MNIIFSILIAFLLVTVLVQIIRISELLAEVNKKNVNDVTEKDNDIQGKIYFLVFCIFIGFVIWQMIAWNHFLLPGASSDHGEIIDGLMSFTMNLILVAFFILTPMLAYFSLKYRGKKGNSAYYYTHNNKLEIIWTVGPTIILTGVIIYGLNVWNKVMNANTDNATVIELYGKQFNWTARYSGADNTLGKANFKLVKGKNKLGVDMQDEFSQDDFVIEGPVDTLHLVIDKPVLLRFRSQDVIHSAFLPHFRVQMNCVPGMWTQFAFTPNKTTAQMQEEEGDDFTYVVLCNKICGATHFNMRMPVLVETQEEYDKWLAKQKLLKTTLTLKTN